MRVYDRIAGASIKHDSHDPEALQDCTVIAADAIAQDLFGGGDIPCVCAYPYAVAPFPRTFVEGWFTHPRWRGRLGFGWFVRHSRVDYAVANEFFISLDSKQRLPPTDTQYFIQHSVLYSWGLTGGCSGGTIALIDADGTLLGHEYATHNVEDSDLLTVQIGMALLFKTLSLLHCKNIALEAHDPPAALAKKQLRKHGIALHRYYTLRVSTPSGQKRTGVARDGQTELPQHIVRGHFKTYTPDKPLFGALTGTYWWPAHARGDREHGTITKDYEVVLPE